MLKSKRSAKAKKLEKTIMKKSITIKKSFLLKFEGRTITWIL